MINTVRVKFKTINNQVVKIKKRGILNGENRDFIYAEDH